MQTLGEAQFLGNMPVGVEIGQERFGGPEQARKIDLAKVERKEGAVKQKNKIESQRDPENRLFSRLLD
jgi:hypothetical protein